jgi:hypothetical protein
MASAVIEISAKIVVAVRHSFCLPIGAVIIRRCAWHRAYHGYPIAFGIASWSGLGVSYTDGMCRGCTIRFRRQWNLPELSDEPSWIPSLVRGAVAVAVVMVLIVTVRSSDSNRAPATMTSPPETVFVPTPVEVEPTSVVPAPRPARPVSRRVASAVAKAALPAPPARREPWLSFDERDTEPFVLVSAIEPDEDRFESDRPYPPKSRFPRRSMFAALPHAGLTLQTP